MRLTHLKLAGFKSFVDPTTLHIHGQRVGIVGPNGCGKSNVMESVRWVLGESSAKEMRADAMDAVIFNGSGNRKPISRASVELVFDNSLGGASGEWSQYAEISVKRVIERDKGSTYYINNTAVRRKDIADLFLGTGLGGKAYAIIGQNTISRIVEAKPEEMRVFLEEAAGITKYKERRRETELRLRDTRENLTRVEDILRELEHQILRLQAQAAVATEYHKLQELLTQTKGQIWLLKKQEAGANWEKAKRQVEKLANELESQMANLRSSESLLEKIRQLYTEATDQVNAAQAEYYEANASVSTLENQVKNTAEARERLQQQQQQLQAQLERNGAQHAAVEAESQQAQSNLLTAKGEFEETEASVKAAQIALNHSAENYQAALKVFNQSHTAWLNAEQKVRLEQASISHLNRSLGETSETLKRLQQNLASVVIPADENLLQKQAELEKLQSHTKEIEVEIAGLTHLESGLHHAIKNLRDNAHSLQKDLQFIQAEMTSLTKIQEAMRNANNESGLADWLKKSGLNQQQRFWQGVSIKSGWETALESALGSRLNAIMHRQLSVDSRPPGALCLALTGEIASTNRQPSNGHHFKPLSSLIERIESGCQAAVTDWLAGAYAYTEDLPENAHQLLGDGECLVNKHGDIYTRYSVVYYGAQSLLHGVLERQTRLDQLIAQCPELESALQIANQQILEQENLLQQHKTNQHALLQQQRSLAQQMHQLHLSVQQMKQQQESALQRKKILETDIAAAEYKLQGLTEEKTQKEQSILQIHQGLGEMQAEKSQLESSKQLAEKALNEARARLQSEERLLQEKVFNIKLIENNIKDLNSRIEFLLEEKNSLNIRIQDTESMLEATRMEALKANLETALNVKREKESALTTARNSLAEQQEALMQQERKRMQDEQLLHPLRDKLESARLGEQQARLYFEQCQSELANFAVDEAVLSDQLKHHYPGNIKVGQLEQKKIRLESEIEALGAVNLAAIEELASEQARKEYLDSQSQDLIQASETLEEAIRKIDRETRSRLQATFDEANRHFNELFTTLFGGGQARLVLLGDEILDTGMQVFAQPPGKKNSTIHLLSGGEKALTALALVFALFRLNPAPFCLMDEVDAPLDDSNTERFCAMVRKMSERTQFLYVSHNKITMEMAQQLIGVTMQESGVSRIVDVDMEAAVKMAEA